MSNHRKGDSISEKSDEHTHTENASHTVASGSGKYKQNSKGNDKDDVANMQALTRKLENPLYDIEKSDLIKQAEQFADEHGLSEDKELFIKAAILAQNPKNFHDLEELSDEDKASLQHEIDHKWRQPYDLYFLAAASGMAAVVQGMDETVVSGAQLYYLPEFGIKNNDLLTGLVNGAPYLCCAVLGCWLTEPLNRWLGRRGTIFLSCTIAALASIWEAFTYSWPQLFAARYVFNLFGPFCS